MTKYDNSDPINDFMRQIVLVIGICIFGYQVFVYLYHGYWKSISIIDCLSFAFKSSSLTSFASWLENPNSWVGVHNILSWLPTSLCIIIIGLYIFFSEDF